MTESNSFMYFEIYFCKYYEWGNRNRQKWQLLIFSRLRNKFQIIIIQREKVTGIILGY